MAYNIGHGLGTGIRYTINIYGEPSEVPDITQYKPNSPTNINLELTKVNHVMLSNVHLIYLPQLLWVRFSWVLRFLQRTDLRSFPSRLRRRLFASIGRLRLEVLPSLSL